MHRYCILLLIVGLVICAPATASAHGTGYRLLDGSSSVALEFYYSTGDTMSYLETKVYSPADEKFAHQSGRTDALGRFAFVPDVAGTWRVVVRDDEGHLAEAVTEVPVELFASSAAPVQAEVQASPPAGAPSFLRAALGVSIIFNLAFASSFLRKKRQGRAGTDAY